MKVILMIIKDVIIKRKVFTKREYYLKKKIELFQEKCDFIFSEND